MIYDLKLYTPHEKQLDLHNCKTRFIVAAFGRQSGKSTWAINHLARAAWENNRSTYWFVSPTFAQAKVMYRRMMGMIWSCKEIAIKKNQTELRIKFINQSEIKFVSGEVFDSLRGSTLNGVILDEVRDLNPDLWPLVIRPMLATTNGWAGFISTPSGYDHFYDLSKNAERDKAWSFFKAPSTANPLFSMEEFEAAKKNMSEPQFAQEILAEFRNLTSGKTYGSFGEYNKSLECPWSTGKLYSPYHSMVVAMDFNLNPMAWTIGQARADEWYWFNEIHLRDSHTLQAAKELRDRVLKFKAEGYKAEPNLILCGDATGKATQRSSNQSDYDIIKTVLKEADITFRDETPDSNPSIKDRVNAVNMKLKDAKGEPHLWVHPDKCPMLIKDFDRVVWKTGADYILDPGSKKELTHASDGIGYAVNRITPMRGVKEIGQTRILQRTI